MVPKKSNNTLLSGLKKTRPRLLVLDAIRRAEKPLSAQEIYQRTNDTIDLASVYRTLKLFCARGIIFEEKNLHKTRYYFAEQPHHHIVCRSCGRTECIPCKHRPRSNTFTQLAHEYRITGMCNTCA